MVHVPDSILAFFSKTGPGEILGLGLIDRGFFMVKKRYGAGHTRLDIAG